MAGAKQVKVDRVIYENMPDSQTALQALKAGEIDFFEIPPIDLLDTLESDPNIKVEVLNKTGNYGIMRLNFLHPPFDKPEARQAMLYLIDQEEFMKATFGNPKYYKKCPSNFACGTPMENDENTAWFKEAPNVAKAKELFQKAGYDGRPVTLLHATNIDFMNNAAQIAAQRLRSAGVNVQLATSDWGGVVTRRAVKAAPDQGGWNIFITWAGAAAVGSPMAFIGHQANGEKGWFGWPTNEDARKAARQVGRRRQPRRAEGDRARDPEECLELRAARLARPVVVAGRLSQEPERRAEDPGGRSVLEYREDVDSRFTSPRCGERSRAQRAGDGASASLIRPRHPARSFAARHRSPASRGRVTERECPECVCSTPRLPSRRTRSCRSRPRIRPSSRRSITRPASIRKSQATRPARSPPRVRPRSATASS